jgi:hypothetical protein
LAVVLLTPLAVNAQLGLNDAADPGDGQVAGGDRGGDCHIRTIAKGEMSGYGADRDRFAGATLVIRDPHAWRAFWGAHSGDDAPPPDVNFDHAVVIAAIQGLQTTGGGPNITISGIGGDGPIVHVRMVDDPRPGPLDVITNPYHIVAVNARCLPAHASVAFDRLYPDRDSAVIAGRVLTMGDDGHLRPIAGARVVLGVHSDHPRRTQTGRDGSFFFLNVEAGHYTIGADARGFEPQTHTVQVGPGERVRVQFVLDRVELGTLAGHVVGLTPDGVVPLGGALVAVTRGDHIIQHTRTNNLGAYHIGHLLPGEYVVTARADGYVPQHHPAVIESGQRTVVNFELEPR